MTDEDPTPTPASAPTPPPAPVSAQAPAPTLAEAGITPAVVAALAQAASRQNPQPNQAPAPAARRDADYDDDGGRDLSRLPRWAQSEIRRLRDEAAGHRVRFKEAESSGTALRQAIADAAGLDVGNVTTDSLGELFGFLASTAQRNLITTETLRAATKHGADPQALLNWTPFLEAADQLDPSDEDFADQLSELVRDTVDNTHILRATGAATATGQEPAPSQQPVPARGVPARSGVEIPGGSGGSQPITEADLAAMSPQQITAALEAGHLAHLL